jgi:proline dehydrogenase
MNRVRNYHKLLKNLAWKASSIYKIEPKTYQTATEISCELIDKGVLSTVGKFSKEGDSPELIVSEYKTISNELKKSLNTTNSFYLSVKPPALNFEIAFVEKIASVAKSNGHGIHFDSHDYKMASPTFRLVEKYKEHVVAENSSENYWWCGITLPTRWERSIEDANWAIQNKSRVRLVKGEFRAEKSAFEMEPGKGFLLLVEMLSGKIPELAIATHDYELAKSAIVEAKNRKQKVELELLFGMPVGKMISLSNEMDVPLRIYIPYGDTLLLYGALHFMKYPHKLVRTNPASLLSSQKRKLKNILELKKTVYQ